MNERKQQKTLPSEQTEPGINYYKHQPISHKTPKNAKNQSRNKPPRLAKEHARRPGTRKKAMYATNKTSDVISRGANGEQQQHNR